MLEAPVSMLSFARGPALHFAIVVMVAGSIWRLVHFAFSRSDGDMYWARKGYHLPKERWQIDSYAMHIGLILVLFGFTPHILFIGAFAGFTWPGLPTNLILAAATISIGLMIPVLVHRFSATGPKKFSAFDDYFTWTVVFVAMLTGLLCYPHIGGNPILKPYAFLLTAHLFAVEALMIWLPFGKLIHVAFIPLLHAGIRIRELFDRSA